MLQKTQRGARTLRQYSTRGNGIPQSKRKNGAVLLAATGGALSVSAIAFTDDVKHAYEAVERTGRVIGTLAVCINE